MAINRFTVSSARRSPRTLLGTAVATVCLVLATAGCAPSSSVNDDRSGDTKELTWALAAEVPSLFAPTFYSTTGTTLMSLVQGQLLTLDEAGGLQPGVATSWEALDATTYEYTIDGSDVFSDGTPVTAEDVAYSLNLQLDPEIASQQAALFSSVESVSSSGDVVTVKLKAPNSLWKYMPAGIGGYVWQKASVEANPAKYGTPEVLPIGSGPYMVSEYVASSHITMKRNPHFAGEMPQFDTISFKLILDSQTRLLAMKSGEIDGTFDVPSDSSSGQWRTAASVTEFPGLVWRGLTLDMTQKPFDDIHVRKALYHATDREAIANGLLNGMATPSTTPNVPELFYGVLPQEEVDAEYAKIQTFDFDLEKAKAEIAQSSVPEGFETTLNVPDDAASLQLIAQALKASWSEIGVDLTINLMPGGPRFQVILDHKPNLGVQIIGNLPDGPDTTQMADQYFSSSQAVVNGNNSSNFSDPTVDSLIIEATQSTDTEAAARAILEAQILASEQVPVIPLVWGKFAVAVKQGWSVGTFGPFYSNTLWVNQIKAP